MKRYFLARWILPVSTPPLEHGFLEVEAGHIQAWGKVQDLPDSLRTDYAFEDNHALITPGLVNTHAHLEHSFGAPVAISPTETMADWLIRVIQQVMAAPSTEAKAARSQQGIREMLATGTTCVNDITSEGACIRPLQEAGMRAVVSMEFFHPGWETLSIDPIIERYQTLAATLQGLPLITWGLSPHSPYNVSPQAWQAVVKVCRPPVVHTHLAESVDEVAWIAGEASPLNRMHQWVLKRTFTPEVPGKTPTGYLHHFGLLDDQMVAAHGVETTPADRLLIQQQGVRLAHCPRSNLFLQGKTLCWEDWKGLGVPIGLGTDSHLSAPNLDLRAEARAAMAPHGLSPEELLQLLTQGGAKVLGLEHQIGSFGPGKAADFVIWDTSLSPLTCSPADLWIAAETSVQEVVIAGQSRYSAADLQRLLS